MTNASECAHAWRAYTEQEMTDLRRLARPGRPPMAWVESAEQCSACGRIEATVSWYGQVHRVLFGPKEAGSQPVIHWPTSRSATGGGGMGMGQS